MNDYMNMRDIGKPFGLSPTKVGRELRDCGYRDEDGRATHMALGSRMAVLRRDAEHPEWITVVWNKVMVCELLEDFGWKRTVEDGAE